MEEKDKKDLEEVRKALRKAANVEDPRDMWILVKESLDLLTLIVSPG